MKWGLIVYKLFQNFSKDPEGTISFLGWLVGAAIETAIISVIVAAIAHASNKDNDFGEWFVGSCIVVGIVEIILGFIGLVS